MIRGEQTHLSVASAHGQGALVSTLVSRALALVHLSVTTSVEGIDEEVERSAVGGVLPISALCHGGRSAWSNGTDVGLEVAAGGSRSSRGDHGRRLGRGR
jgi:hypothetical protein